MRKLMLSIVIGLTVLLFSCCLVTSPGAPLGPPVTPAPVELEIRPKATATDPAPTKTVRPRATLTDTEREMRFIMDALAYGDCVMPAMQNIQLQIGQAEDIGGLGGIVYAAEDLRDCHQLLPRNPPPAWKSAHQHMVRADTCLIQVADSLERLVMSKNLIHVDHVLQALDCVSQEYGAAMLAIPK